MIKVMKKTGIKFHIRKYIRIFTIKFKFSEDHELSFKVKNINFVSWYDIDFHR